MVQFRMRMIDRKDRVSDLYVDGEVFGNTKTMYSLYSAMSIHYSMKIAKKGGDKNKSSCRLPVWQHCKSRLLAV
jgi:hypothetical protein